MVKVCCNWFYIVLYTIQIVSKLLYSAVFIHYGFVTAIQLTNTICQL